jgi:hypothetical protein
MSKNEQQQNGTGTGIGIGDVGEMCKQKMGRFTDSAAAVPEC